MLEFQKALKTVKKGTKPYASLATEVAGKRVAIKTVDTTDTHFAIGELAKLGAIRIDVTTEVGTSIIIPIKNGKRHAFNGVPCLFAPPAVKESGVSDKSA